MPRIPEALRLPMVDAHLAHYAEANAINGSAIELIPGVGLPQIQTGRDNYATVALTIQQIEGSDLPTLREERASLWGISPEDDGGIWFRLTQYKTLVRARLGVRHPLSRTIPNLGVVTVERYLSIIQNFIDHWERVNAALTPDLTLGTFTLALLQTARDNLATKLAAIATAETSLAVKRAEREQLFGDEAEEVRDETSLIARLLLYHATIPALFPNQPIADTLPNIYPTESSASSVPTFGFNYVAQSGGVLKTWFDVASAPAGTALVFLKEGAVEQTMPLQSAPPGGMQVDLWSGVTLVGDLDDIELRTAAGLTLARGVRDNDLTEPT